jgi:hypothetical protein
MRRAGEQRETGIIARFRDDYWLAVLRYPAGDPLSQVDTKVAVAGRFAGRNCVVQILLFFVDDQQGPGFGFKKLLHLLHDCAKDGIQIERGCQRTRYVMKDPKVLGQWRTLWEGSIDHRESRNFWLL